MNDHKIVEIEVISALSKMSIKCTVVAQIYAFKQRDQELLRDSIRSLRQYIMSCRSDENSNQGQLVSIFLEGLRNKMVHAHLYAHKHKTLHEFFLDAMAYDDNFDLDNSPKKSKRDEELCPMNIYD